MEWTKKTWLSVLLITIINMLLSGVIAFIVNAYSAREETLQGAASVEYVDKQDSALNAVLCKQDTRIVEVYNKMDTKADKVDIVRMDNKLDKIYEILLEMVKENNKSTVIK